MMQYMELPPDSPLRVVDCDDKSRLLFFNSETSLLLIFDQFADVLLEQVDHVEQYAHSPWRRLTHAAIIALPEASSREYNLLVVWSLLQIAWCFYHDGLRTITAENARHSSNLRATPSDLPLVFICPSRTSLTYLSSVVYLLLLSMAWSMLMVSARRCLGPHLVMNKRKK